MQMVTNESRKHTPLTDSVASKKYQDLTPNECLVLTFLDSCCPGPDAVAWPCDYDHLIRLASQSPCIEEDKVIAAIGSLVHCKVIDTDFALVNDKLEIWVSRWQHRARLRHELVTQLTRQRREMVDRVAAQKNLPAA